MYIHLPGIRYKWVGFILILSLLSAGCGQLRANIAAPDGSDSGGVGEEVEFDEIDLSGKSDDQGEVEPDGDSGDSESPFDILDDIQEEVGKDKDPVQSEPSVDDPLAGICPQEPANFTLFLTHSWEFSPGMQTEVMLIKGNTEPSSDCSFLVEKNKVTFPSCYISFTNTGTMISESGTQCELNATATALVEVIPEDSYCRDGVLVLTISEIWDGDAPYNSTLKCGNNSFPHVAYYSPLIRTVEFALTSGVVTAEENVEKFANSWNYNRVWSVGTDYYSATPPPD